MNFIMRDALANFDRNNFDVLPENKKQQRWNECVSSAKELIAKYKDIRFQVVQLALSVCVYHHGGRSAPERFSVKNFAEEIGLPNKTLNEWIRIKTKIYDNLPEKTRETVSYGELRALDFQTRSEKVDDKEFSSKLLQAHIEFKKKNPTTIKMEKYLKHLKTIHFNVKHPRMIKDCDEEVLTEILSVSREIVKLLAPRDAKPKYANVD